MHQWISFSVDIAWAIEKGPKQEQLVRWAWDMIMRIMDILEPNYSSHSSQGCGHVDFHSMFLKYEEHFLYNIHSLNELIRAVGAGNVERV